MPDPPRPPVAPARPTTLRHFDDERVDPWFWLRERDDPDVLAYLEAENAYTEASLADTGPLRERLYSEIVGRVRQTDVSPPVRRGDFEYFSRTIEGQQYDVHCRRPAALPALPDPDAPPGPRRARPSCSTRTRSRQGHDYFAVGDLAVNPAQTLAAYTTDTSGGERYDLRFRSLRDGRRPSRRRDRRVLRRRVGERRPHRALHPARRGDAPLAGVATHRRHDGRRRRARLPGGRRPVLRVGGPRPHRPRAGDRVGVEGDHRSAAGRRRRRRRRCPRRRATRAGSRVPRGAPRRPRRQPALRAHQRRRRRELRVDGHTHGQSGARELDDRARAPAGGPPRRRRRVRRPSRRLRARRRPRAPAGVASG